MMIEVAKIIHTLKILTYTITLLEYHCQKIISTVEFRDHSLQREAQKIILSEILDWWKQKTWNLIFIFIWIFRNLEEEGSLNNKSKNNGLNLFMRRHWVLTAFFNTVLFICMLCLEISVT